jgi:hypothetical protein
MVGGRDVMEAILEFAEQVGSLDLTVDLTLLHGEIDLFSISLIISGSISSEEYTDMIGVFCLRVGS